MTKDILEDLKALPINGYKIASSENGRAKVYKFRYKDKARNIGSRGGYRVVCVVVTNTKTIPFHIYHKRSGKKPKDDLTEDEKKTIRKIAEDAAEV